MVGPVRRDLQGGCLKAPTLQSSQPSVSLPTSQEPVSCLLGRTCASTLIHKNQGLPRTETFTANSFLISKAEISELSH